MGVSPLCACCCCLLLLPAASPCSHRPLWNRLCREGDRRPGVAAATCTDVTSSLADREALIASAAVNPPLPGW
ncbi:MAG: hypothetical protein ACYTF0_06600 [Planctomycetota bacterium]|jgi:hypothetical protein